MADINLIIAFTQNYIVYGGQTFERTFEFFSDNATPPVVPLDIRGYTFAMELRKPGSNSGTAKISLALGTGLTIGGVDNNALDVKFDVILKGGIYDYDILATDPSGNTNAYFDGIFTVTQRVTKANLDK